ncbi:STAS domain-containing protein [Kineococcus sp. SYSU DK002]|uniref:STAS domain-containing protein n=1 Tax=Kineococcus sp. SYSU DK002 TaxID=3383123 RepID=UPI003D7D657A
MTRSPGPAVPVTPGVVPVVAYRLTTAPADPHGAELPTASPRPLAADPPEAPEASSVTTRRDGDRFEVVLRGDVDLTLAPQLAAALERVDEHCARHPRARVHLDVREVRALDAGALRFVEAVRAACAGRGAGCTTSAARPVVTRVLDLARAVPGAPLTTS